MEEINNSSESPPQTSFSMLPYDVTVQILSRVPRINRPILSLVSKSFRSIIASPELDATRTLIGKTDDCLYVCLDLDKKNPNPRWFVLAPTPNGQKLLPLPNSLAYQHHKSSTVVSIGSEMYIIGGLLNNIRSRRVLVLDCRTHQWSTLQNMCVRCATPAVVVIGGKLHVVGGCSHDNIKYWGEVYDPNTQTWEPLSYTPQAFSSTWIIGDKLYGMNMLNLDLKLKESICLVEIGTNELCQINTFSTSEIYWRDDNDSVWRSVKGLEELTPKPSFRFYLASVVSSSRRRVTVLWKKAEYRGKDLHDTIWCTEISFQRLGERELKGFIEWSKSVFALGEHDHDDNFCLHSNVVTH